MITYGVHDILPDIETYMKEVSTIPDRFFHYDEYRNTLICPLFAPSGGLGPRSFGSLPEKTEASTYCGSLMEFMGKIHHLMPGYITILKTPAGTEMNPHIDCAEEEVGSEQYKWRMSLTGDRESLFFIDKDGNRIYPNKGEPCYVIDGGHMHGVDKSNKDKITVCIGYPWRSTLPDNIINTITIERQSYDKG